MEGCELARGDAALGAVEDDIYSAILIIDGSVLQRLAVAYAHTHAALLTCLHFVAGAHPVHIFRKQTHYLAVEALMFLPFSHIDAVALHVGGNDEDGVLVTAYAEALALPQSVELGAFVLAGNDAPGVEAVAGLFLMVRTPAVSFGRKYYVRIVIRPAEFEQILLGPAFHRTGKDFLLAGMLCGVGIILRKNLNHLSFNAFELLLQEDRKVHLADEANALRVLFVCGRQVGLLREAAHFAFAEIPYRKYGGAQLLLAELAEEVALVLAGIHTFQQAYSAVGVLPSAAVMPCGNCICTKLSGSFEEGVELDLAVAEHIRIGGSAVFVFGEHIVHDPLAVLPAQVHKVERNAQLAGDQLGNELVLLPLAVTVQSTFGIVPVLHKHSKDIIALLLEKQSGNTGVNTS